MSVEQSMLESWGPELGVVVSLDPHHPVLTWDFNVFDYVCISRVRAGGRGAPLDAAVPRRKTPMS